MPLLPCTLSTLLFVRQVYTQLEQKFIFPTLAHSIKLLLTFPSRRDADMKARQVKWQLLHLWLSNVQAPVLLSAAGRHSAQVKNSCHDPSSSWEIWFDGDARRCPTFCAALLGTVLTLPFSPSRKKKNRKTQSRAQRNNCTKYSPVVTIETSADASD